MSDSKWMRVIDPGSPLCGWDLLCEPHGSIPGSYEVLAARRLDVLVGDRPLQFNPPDGLGMTISSGRVADSPLQGAEPIEIAVDAEGLYGDHVETREYKFEADDGTWAHLTVEVFESSVQAALAVGRPDGDPDEKADIFSTTWFGPPDEAMLARLANLMEDGDIEGAIGMIDGGEDGRAKA